MRAILCLQGIKGDTGPAGPGGEKGEQVRTTTCCTHKNATVRNKLKYVVLFISRVSKDNQVSQDHQYVH